MVAEQSGQETRETKGEAVAFYQQQEKRTVKRAGHPPHFTQTLVSVIAADGEEAKFEGVVTGLSFCLTNFMLNERYLDTGRFFRSEFHREQRMLIFTVGGRDADKVYLTKNCFPPTQLYFSNAVSFLIRF